jgi:hypothetical protein
MSYVRVSILGRTTGGEVWSINPVFDPSGEFEGGVNQSQLDTAAAAIAALSPGTFPLSTLSQLMFITGARVEVRADATDALIATSTAQRATALQGSGGCTNPPQTAIVLSLRTNTPGASGRGRLYWPSLTTQIDSNGRITSTTTTNILSGIKAYLLAQRDALAAAFPLIGFDVAVRSKTTKSTPHVVRMQVGDILDTQRRRRDTLPESYIVTSVP